MAAITTRQTAGTGATVANARLTNTQVDNNFININTEVVGLTQSNYRIDSSVVQNAMVTTFSPAWASYGVGSILKIKPAYANTGAVTLNVDGLGILPVVDYYGNALVGGELVATVSVELYCTGSAFRITSSAGGAATTNMLSVTPASGANTGIKNASTGTFTLGTNSVTSLTCNADGSVTVPTLTCTNNPTLPTPSTADTTTKGATTAFVGARITQDRPFEATASNIKINGTQAVGSLNTVARGDHVHPVDTSRQAALGYTAANKDGDTLTGTLHGTASVGTIGDVVNNNGSFVAHATGSNAAYITLLRDSLYGIKFGLDTDNILKFGGYSAGAVANVILHSGNRTTYGCLEGNTRISFFQSAAPTGWEQLTAGECPTNSMLRAVSGTGGGAGGTDSAILNNKITSHTHAFSGTAMGAHDHTVGNLVAATLPPTGPNYIWSQGGGNNTTTTSAGTPAGTIGAPAGASNWAPKYIDMIICKKS